MPRAHRRCGSNLLAGVLPILLVGVPLFAYHPVPSALVMIFGWMFRFQIGYVIQQVFATKEPSEKQLRAGLEAGRKVMEAWRREPHKRVPPLVNLWQRGFLQMFGGVIVGMWALRFFYSHLHVLLDF